MTQPALPPPEGAAASELAELGRTSDAAISAASKTVAGITADDEAGLKRQARAQFHEAFVMVKLWGIFAAGALGIILAVIGSGAIVWIIYRWIWTFIDDPVKLGSVVTGGVWALLIAASTSFINRLISEKEK